MSFPSPVEVEVLFPTSEFGGVQVVGVTDAPVQVILRMGEQGEPGPPGPSGTDGNISTLPVYIGENARIDSTPTGMKVEYFDGVNWQIAQTWP